ncbi:MAG: glycosyltransferase, partial [Firmicutes bacterium]|nr:glycosyltransferase [Bacillota bacterium]
MPKTLYLTVPCYKEEEVLSETAKRLLAKFTDLMAENTISSASKIVFINDGSKDKTWEIICELHASNPVFVGINLSRNKGHQNALLAGLIWAKDNADAVISMDADLQDDINAVDEMWAKFNEGFDVVYGVRSKRTT